MRTLSLQLIAATTLLLCTGCQACFDSINRFEMWKTEKCCNLFHCHKAAPPAVIYAPVAPVVQQCPQPLPVTAAPCAQPAPICAPIQCDPCASSASQVSSAPCCPPPCCVTECCPSPCSTSYVSSTSGDACCNSSTSSGTIVNGSTFQGSTSPQLAPGPAAIGNSR